MIKYYINLIIDHSLVIFSN